MFVTSICVFLVLQNFIDNAKKMFVSENLIHLSDPGDSHGTSVKQLLLQCHEDHR